MDNEKLLRLLVIEDSLNDAEMVVSLLRNAGHAVRPSSAEDEEELRTILQQKHLELILCSTIVEEPSLNQVVQHVRQLEKDIPILAVAPELNPDEQIQFMNLGACDVVSRTHPEHLQSVVARELGNLQTRRKLRSCLHSMRETEKRCHALLDSSRDAIAYVHEGMHIYANSVYLELFGFDDAEEIEGTPIMDMVVPSDHPSLKEFLRQCHDGESSKDLAINGLKSDSSTFKATMEFSPASIDGEPCTQIVIRDRTSNKELEQKLATLSVQDLLTGLYNRQYFLEQLDSAIAQALEGAHSSAILFLEPDNFSKIKETAGIAGADLVLSDIASLLTQSLDEKDVACRFGDASFSVLTSMSNPDDIKELAQKICTTVENHLFDIGGKSITATCSIGISIIGETTAGSSRDALTHAETACANAAAAGGNQINLHNTADERKADQIKHEHWADKLREAVSQNQFELVFQPIASLHGEPGEKYEVLLRYKDQDENSVSPKEFMAAATEHNLTIEIDSWVIKKAVQVLAARRAQGFETMFFVKLSADTVTDKKLLPWISNLLKAARLPGNLMVFQLAESAVVTHLKEAREFAHGLKQLRIPFGLDHFGNGVNSFQLLKHIPVTYLKIDPSFMDNLADSQENQATVKEITEMAHSMKKAVIAQFVEDANSLSILWQCGVNYIQGNFLQEPEKELRYDFEGDNE